MKWYMYFTIQGKRWTEGPFHSKQQAWDWANSQFDNDGHHELEAKRLYD